VDKDIKNKENYRSIFLMNIGTKILDKIQTKFNSMLKRSSTIIKLVSFHECKDGSKYVNQLT
jgi:hypothetical protein